MKQSFVVILAVVAAGAVFAGLVLAVLAGMNVSEPAVTAVYGLTLRRAWATAAAVLALAGVVIGGITFARPFSRFGTMSGQLGPALALMAGLVAAVNGGLTVAVATGGPGTGNGVVGGAAALVLGLVAAGIGGLGLARHRRSPSIQGT